MPIPDPLLSDTARLDELIGSVLDAGEAALDIYRGAFTVEAKGDASPVTEADRVAEAILLEGLKRMAPGTPVVAEEACSTGEVPRVGRSFFLVDPVDGTREFVGRNGDFTVNVALIENGVPILGLVHAPVRGELYMGRAGIGAERFTLADGRIAAKAPIHVAPEPRGAPRILASRSHRTAETDAFIARFPGASIVSAGSSLKFCLIAAGEADLYPRLGPTMQWDTAAGDAVLRAAGGMVSRLDGSPLIYGPAGGSGVLAFANPWFVATGGKARPQR